MGQSDIENKPAGSWKQRLRRRLPLVAVISDPESARQVGKLVALVAYLFAASLILDTHLSTFVIVDAALFAGLGFGVSRMSRACAVSVPLVYIASFVLNSGQLWNELAGSTLRRLGLSAEEAFHSQLLTQFANGFALAVEVLFFGLLLAYFVEGIRGTFAYHRYENEQAASATVSS